MKRENIKKTDFPRVQRRTSSLKVGKSVYDSPISLYVLNYFLKKYLLLPGGYSYLVLLSYVLIHEHIDLASSDVKCPVPWGTGLALRFYWLRERFPEPILSCLPGSGLSNFFSNRK